MRRAQQTSNPAPVIEPSHMYVNARGRSPAMDQPVCTKLCLPCRRHALLAARPLPMAHIAAFCTNTCLITYVLQVVAPLRAKRLRPTAALPAPCLLGAPAHAAARLSPMLHPQQSRRASSLIPQSAAAGAAALPLLAEPALAGATGNGTAPLSTAPLPGRRGFRFRPDALGGPATWTFMLSYLVFMLLLPIGALLHKASLIPLDVSPFLSSNFFKLPWATVRLLHVCVLYYHFRC